MGYLVGHLHSQTSFLEGPYWSSQEFFCEQSSLYVAFYSGTPATLVTIQGAHTLDFVIAVLGPLTDLSALATTQYPQTTVGDLATEKIRSTPDHLLVQARFGAGVPLSVEVAGGRPPESVAFRMEVDGEKGTLSIDGGAPRGFQSGKLRVSWRGEFQNVDEGEVAAMPTEAANVATMYAALRDDIFSGTWTVPDFEHAVRLTKLVGDLTASSQTGGRKLSADCRLDGVWPL